MKENQEGNMEQAILETAERLFLDKGFALTSTTEIAREVGCNQALVHYYYRTKEKLFEKIFERMAKMMLAVMLKEDDASKPFEERLSGMIQNHFDLLLAHPKLPFLFFNELITNPKRLEMLASKLRIIPLTVLSQLKDQLNDEIRKGRIRPIAPETLLLNVVSLNVTPFLVKPIFKAMTDVSEKEYLRMLESRKMENVHIILSSLKINIDL